jgi:hypothetical protein
LLVVKLLRIELRHSDAAALLLPELQHKLNNLVVHPSSFDGLSRQAKAHPDNLLEND